MFFRMLKKDIMERKGLNVILLVFMCLASILTVCSSIVLYANTFGVKKTMKKVNAAEVSLVTVRDLNDIKCRQDRITDWLFEQNKVEGVELGETIQFRSNAVDYLGFDEEKSVQLVNRVYYAFDTSMEHNKVVDMDGEYLDLPYGTIAIPQYVHNIGGIDIGDTVHITTQMGNIYEFTVAAIFKDPAMNGWYRLYFNDEDFEIIKSESPVICDVFAVNLEDGSTNVDETQIVNDFGLMHEEFGELVNSMTMSGYNDDRESAVFLNVLMILAAVFIIAMVFMTISFTIKTAIKSEEKELGMLKALGVESASFNWLFAAKYLANALAATVVGFFGGIHLSNLDIKYITYGQLKPDVLPMVIVAFSASFLSFGLIIFFVSFSLRRMKKISIMDVIAGENRGERFKALPGMFLHRIKNINIPFYLALTDLTNRIKRYSFLIIAYTMGITAMILLLETRNTSNSAYWMEYYWGYPSFDFAIELPDEVMEKYVERGGNTKRAFEIINQELKDAGIPATVNYFNWSGRRKLTFKGKEIVCFFQCDYPSRVNGEIYKGVNPKLRNEVLMDAYHAQIHGIEIGDTVTLEYDKYNEDGITYSKVEEDFIVTGLVNSPTAYLELIMSDEFKDAAGLQTISAGSTINAPKSEHAKYIEMMRDMYGKSSIRNRKEEVKYQLGGYKTEWDLLLAILLPTLAGMMILATILYQSVNIIDETPDIALLKCSGFSNSVIKAWQVIRVVLITGISSVASVVLLNTLLKVLIGKAYFFMGNIVEYEPNRNILLFYIALPLAVIIILAFAIYLTLYGVKKIELWKLRDN